MPSPWPPQTNISRQVEAPPYIASPPSVINVSIGRQLFVDTFLVEQMTGRLPHAGGELRVGLGEPI